MTCQSRNDFGRRGRRRSGHFTALDDVSATFEANKVTSIIGPNGAGKSTFFNILSGALAPTRGSVRFRGQDLGGVPHHRFAHLGIARSYQIGAAKFLAHPSAFWQPTGVSDAVAPSVWG